MSENNIPDLSSFGREKLSDVERKKILKKLSQRFRRGLFLKKNVKLIRGKVTWSMDGKESKGNKANSKTEWIRVDDIEIGRFEDGKGTFDKFIARVKNSEKFLLDYSKLDFYLQLSEKDIDVFIECITDNAWNSRGYMIRVFKLDDGTYRSTDGSHRLLLAKYCGIKKVNAIIYF